MSASLPPQTQSPEPGPPLRQASWRLPETETQGLARYLEAIRAGIWIIVGAVIVAVAAAALYLSQADKVYEASSDILITPQSTLDFPVSGIIQQSSDPTRDIETVARLVTSPNVTRLVREELNIDGGLQGIAGKVSATPLAQSNIVTVTASGASPAEAVALADAYGEQFIVYRNQQLRQTLAPQIAALRDQVGDDAGSGSGDADSPQAELRTYERLRGGGDPSVSLESKAEAPSSASSPRPVLTLASALVGGVVLGLVGAFGLYLLDPRLRNEERLREQFRLPILARIPLERRNRKRPLLPSELSLGALDGFQALRASLSTSRRQSLTGQVVLVTGPTPGDGKSTAAINLASTIAAAGKRVILIEADSRRPSIGRALNMTGEVGLASVITGRRYLVDSLQPVGDEDSRLRVLLTSTEEAPAADVLSHVSVDTLLLQARRLADYVIVDSPPLNHVAETLAIAKSVDDVLIVVRVGKTNNRDLAELAEMLAQQEIVPTGFVVLGGHARQSYY